MTGWLDPDNDGDTVPDVDDACPNLAGVLLHNGCPPPGPPLAVGGIVGLLDADDAPATTSESTSDDTAYIAALAAIIGTTVIAGGWYVRRRWLP